MKQTIRFELNDRPRELRLEEKRSLLWVIRTDLGLTGTKYGCGLGFCGSCTVLVNNEPIRSCIVPVSYIDGKQVKTIEGLARDGNLHSIQKAFIKHDAMQCGYCTPGMILKAYGLLFKNPQPTRTEIVQGMEQNLCRCGSYKRIIEAIQSSSKEKRG